MTPKDTDRPAADLTWQQMRDAVLTEFPNAVPLSPREGSYCIIPDEDENPNDALSGWTTTEPEAWSCAYSRLFSESATVGAPQKMDYGPCLTCGHPPRCHANGECCDTFGQGVCGNYQPDLNSRILLPRMPEPAAVPVATETASPSPRQQEWISVSQELPPVGVWVLGWLYLPKNPPASGHCIAQYTGCKKDEPESFGRVRMTVDCWWGNGLYYPAGHFTHWIPLPAAPSEPVPNAAPLPQDENADDWTCSHCSRDMRKMRIGDRCSNEGLCVSIADYESRKAASPASHPAPELPARPKAKTYPAHGSGVIAFYAIDEADAYMDALESQIRQHEAMEQLHLARLKKSDAEIQELRAREKAEKELAASPTLWLNRALEAVSALYRPAKYHTLDDARMRGIVDAESAIKTLLDEAQNG